MAVDDLPRAFSKYAAASGMEESRDEVVVCQAHLDLSNGISTYG